MHCLISSVANGAEVRPPLGDFGRALFRQALLVLRGHPSVASWLSHEGLPNLKGGLVTSLRHPARSYGRGQGSPFGKSRREVEVGQVALKRPVESFFLVAGDSRRRDPREHQALGETILVHPGYVPSLEQRATCEVVLEREDPGALLGALGSDAVDMRLNHGENLLKQ